MNSNFLELCIGIKRCNLQVVKVNKIYRYTKTTKQRRFIVGVVTFKFVQLLHEI